MALPDDSAWYSESLYFAHFAISDIAANEFHAYERFARPGLGLAGAQESPYRIWLEDWSIVETGKDTYRLQAAQDGIAIDLALTDEMGVILHGENGYSCKGREVNNASDYYSQPRLRAEGTVLRKAKPIQSAGWHGRITSSAPEFWIKDRAAGTGFRCNSIMARC